MPSLALLDIFRNDAHGLTTPLSVQMLQTALHDKAKGSPKFRFYALYDKVYREDVLASGTNAAKPTAEQQAYTGQTFETGRAYMGTVASKKRVIRICEALSKMTGRDQTLLD